MKYEAILPVDFDGTFRFTNWTDEDFVGKWGGKEYHFPAGTTSPMVIVEHTPLEIQQIRKKFAKDLAEREYVKSDAYSFLIKQERNPDGTARLNGIQSAGSYSIDALAPFIQRCLEPLPVAQATIVKAQGQPLEEKLTRDEEGNLNTEVVDRKTSLKAKAEGR